MIVFSISGLPFNCVHSPFNLEDYDKYWRWLFKGQFECGFCGSETFEEFKQEVIDTEEMDPCITEETKSDLKLSENYLKKNLKNV